MIGICNKVLIWGQFLVVFHWSLGFSLMRYPLASLSVFGLLRNFWSGLKTSLWCQVTLGRLLIGCGYLNQKNLLNSDSMHQLELPDQDPLFSPQALVAVMWYMSFLVQNQAKLVKEYCCPWILYLVHLGHLIDSIVLKSWEVRVFGS